MVEHAQGTRRIYHLQAQGLNAVQEYLEDIWGEAAETWRDRNRVGWQTLIPYFRHATEKGEAP